MTDSSEQIPVGIDKNFQPLGDNKVLLYFLPACGSAVSFFYFVSFLFYLGYYYGGLVNLGFSAFYLITFLFYLTGNKTTGKHYLAILFIIQVTLHSTYLFPKESYFQLFFLVAMPLIFMLFEASEKKSRLVYGVLVFILLGFIELRDDQVLRPIIFHPPDISLTRNYNIFCSFFVLSITAYLYIRHIEKQRSTEHQLAITDPLTGILNQREFERRAKEFFSNNKISVFSVLFIDIDNFKQINDQYGHLEGDQVIRDIADFLQSHAAQHDILARVGGDEFIVVLTVDDSTSSALVANEIRQGISIAVSSQRPFKLSVSVGISSYQPSDDSIQTIIKRADKALYQAKKTGRNRVETG